MYWSNIYLKYFEENCDDFSKFDIWKNKIKLIFLENKSTQISGTYWIKSNFRFIILFKYLFLMKLNIKKYYI